jgi:hypothetical protein
VDLVGGRGEVLPMPSRRYQKITAFLYRFFYEHGVFQRGTIATSLLLAGVEVAVDAVFDVT